MTKRTLIVAALYLIPLGILYGALSLPQDFNIIAVLFGFAAGVIYSAIQAMVLIGDERG